MKSYGIALLQMREILGKYLWCLLLAWPDPVFHSFVHQSVNICVNPYFDPNVQVHFPRTIKASVMILGISLH